MMKHLRAALPLVLTLLGFVVLGGLALRRIVALGLTAAGALCAAAFVTYAAWLAWESRVSAREIDRASGDRDRGTMELAAAAKYALLLGALIPATTPRLAFALPGLALMIAGALLRVRAIHVMGASYTHRIRFPVVPLVTSGPYAWIRHPAYFGTLLAHAGLVLVMLNAWSLSALLTLWVPAVLLRTALEDRWLRERLPIYADYATRVRASYVPGLF
jgi:protein-S-isoprenylcysteine O-methyltransferase Ste14